MKIAFLSAFALDANASLVNALSKNNDVYFFIEALYKVSNFLDRSKLRETITTGKNVEELQHIKDFINLDKTYVIKGTRNINILKKLYISYKVNQWVRKINPDVIIIDNYMLTYFVSTLNFRKKMLMIVHDPFLHSGENYFIDRYLRKLHFNLIDHKILLNENQKNDFIKYYHFNPKHISTSFLGVYDFLRFYDYKNVEAKSFNVLFFGRISPYKGIKYLLDGFVTILLSYPEYKGKISLTIAGSGDFDFDLKPYESFENIFFINNYIDPQNLAQLINQANVVVCPYTDATQSGVIMSAFAFKKPVIATNVGGLPEMVQNGETGIIIEPKDSNAIAQAIIEIYENNDLRNKISNNIEQKYFFGEKSWNNSAKRFSDALNNIDKSTNL
ncbi:glycosyltransferase family 4 protein [Chryseobacterium binzhouense]|uniref:glycosyltransferase family 4 protein n=1 Tax=Chryseobacterium binzhouense TaxID=2593646 RepID=UPI002898B79C|nr:glycosyltransferase family 4 protein [Chryseobacterium binzhouense]